YIPRLYRKSFFISAGLAVIVCFLPIIILPGSLTLFKSVNLYFQSFEFNASLYYLLRESGYWLTGYNLIRYIGPLLAVLAMYLIIRFSRSVKEENDYTFVWTALISWSFYLFLSSTVHPWYIIPLVFWATLTGFTFPMIWSALIILSYVHYDRT